MLLDDVVQLGDVSVPTARLAASHRADVVPGVGPEAPLTEPFLSGELEEPLWGLLANVGTPCWLVRPIADPALDFACR